MSPSGRPACALLSPSGRPVCVPEADTTEPASCRPVCVLAGSSRRSADESFGTPGLCTGSRHHWACLVPPSLCAGRPLKEGSR